MNTGKIPDEIKHLFRKHAVKYRDYHPEGRRLYTTDKVSKSILSGMHQFEGMSPKSRDRAVKSFWDSNFKNLRSRITHFQNNCGNPHREHCAPFSSLSFGPCVVDTYLDSQTAKGLQKNMDKFITRNMQCRPKGFIQGDWPRISLYGLYT